MMFSEVQMQSDPANPSGLQDSIPLPPYSVTVVVDRGFGHGPQSVLLSIERTAELPMFEGVQFEMADGRLPVRWYLAEYRPGGDNILLGEMRPAESSGYEGGVRMKVEMEVNAYGLCSVDTQWCPLQQATSAGIACPPPLTDVQQDNNHRYVHPMVSSVPVVRPGADIAQQRAGSFAEPAPRVPLRPLNDGRTRGSHMEHDIAVVEDSHEFLVLPVAGSLEFQTKNASSPIPVYAGHSVLPSWKNSELIGLLLPAKYVDDTSGVWVVVNIGVDANGHRSVSAQYSQCLRTVNSVNYTCSPGVFTVVDPISVIEGQPRTVQTTAMRLGCPTYVKVHQVDRRYRVVRNVSEPVDVRQAVSERTACPPPVSEVQQSCDRCHVQNTAAPAVPFVRPRAHDAKPRAGSFAEPAPRVPLRPLNDGRTRGSHMEHDIAVVEDSHEFLVLPVAGSLEFQTKDASSPIPVYAGHSVLPSRKNSELIGLLLPAKYVDDTSGVWVVVNIGVDANGHRSVSAQYSQCLRTVNSVNYTCSPGVFTVVDPISVIEGQPRTVQTTAMRLGGPTYVKVHQVDRRYRVVRNVSEPVDVRQAVSERTACPPPVSEVQQSCDRCHVQNTAAPAVPFVRPRAHDAKPRTGGFEEPARSPAAPVNDRLSAPVFLDMGQYGVIERTPRTVQTIGGSSTEMAAVLDDEPMILLELQQAEPYEDEPEVQQLEPELIGEPAAFIDVQAAVEDDPTSVCNLPQSTKGQKKKRKLWSRVIRMFTHCFRRH